MVINQILPRGVRSKLKLVPSILKRLPYQNSFCLKVTLFRTHFSWYYSLLHLLFLYQNKSIEWKTWCTVWYDQWDIPKFDLLYCTVQHCVLLFLIIDNFLCFVFLLLGLAFILYSLYCTVSIQLFCTVVTTLLDNMYSGDYIKNLIPVM